ncbi:MAG: tRNA (guanosine(46)-N7)-methyltransferase TrmB [Oscillospiraceae bacterium]|nr:tRNA (guanosine(46)-N7)-methyltransferase TrmB [Oscillospiraceae bacterium]
MHMRKKKNRDARLGKVEGYFASTGENGELLPEESFDSPGPLYLEIGCGKGSFITALALRTEGKRLLAVERITDALLMAMEKCAAADCKNLKFLNADAGLLPQILPPHSVERLYLNFSDPWPKNKDRERRLTSRTFLAKYKEILAPGARICFKTDNRPLFDFSLRCFEEEGFTLEHVCYDLHGNPPTDSPEAYDIETEYERKFSAKGFSINYLEAYLPQ